MFDAHFHIIDPRFPLVANQGYRPDPFTVADYRARVAGLGVTGGAVVAGSYQGYATDYLVTALRELGEGFVGVAQLPPDVSEAELRELHAAGVRALRFNLRRRVGGGALDSVDLDSLLELGARAARLFGWPAEFYVDSRELPTLAPRITALPRISVDHLGLSAEGLPALLDLVAAGARVKATGFGRTDMDVVNTLRSIAAVDPRALMFGTDLPSTRAPRPFAHEDRDLVVRALGAEAAEKALGANARAFYGICAADE
ncbi:amidohydrolase family protein [Halostreptopolyspora alba]|uniref:2-pyrone-4,6-dicarboxylate hydrolase n=1 Tax=Halostreptopolyspora alba TaxID=2487137 RepID=A0A3N0E6Q2_9ACTN|nr:2-pyrone-4,6-dicarboxylate hydrolase [Nocardiopsaceae bacterium YIM 96095]